MFILGEELEMSSSSNMSLLDFVIGLYGKECLIFITLTVLYVLIMKLTSTIIYRKSKSLDTYDRIATKLDGPIKYVFILVFILLITLGVYQIFSYYLVATGFFWIILFTVGFALIFILFPYFIIFLPFFKRNKYWGLGKMIPWAIIFGGTSTYGAIIMLDTNTKIYTDEGASGYVKGSLLFKELGGFSLILASLIGVAMIVIKAIATKHTRSQAKQAKEKTMAN